MCRKFVCVAVRVRETVMASCREPWRTHIYTGDRYITGQIYMSHYPPRRPASRVSHELLQNLSLTDKPSRLPPKIKSFLEKKIWRFIDSAGTYEFTFVVYVHTRNAKFGGGNKVNVETKYMHTYTYAHIYAHSHAYTHTHTHTHTYTHTCKHTQTHMHTRTHHINTFTCNIYIHRQVCKYTLTNTYIHTYIH